MDTRERTVTPFRQPPAVEEQIIAPWSDREWREMQRDSEHWWRQLFAPPEPAAEPAPEPVKPQLSTYGREFLARAAPRVRDDARGDGRYTLAQARQQLKDGDPLETVIERTGWGRMWLADLADRLAAS